MGYFSEHPPLIGVPSWSDTSIRYGGVPLYGMNQSYIRALHQTGALTVLIPLELPEWELSEMLRRVDGLFFAGGSDIGRNEKGDVDPDVDPSIDAARDRVELALARRALNLGMPVLGVCRGMQLINVARGGTLYRDLATDRPDLAKHDFFPPDNARNRISHGVRIEPGSYLHSLFGNNAQVNSMHHQAIEAPGEGIRIAAISDDGIPEAITVDGHPFALGVQWHPEELFATHEGHAALFRHLARHAQIYAAARHNAVVVETKPRSWFPVFNGGLSLPAYAAPAV